MSDLFQQWEYHTVFLHLPLKPEERSRQLNKQLNKYGLDGWELVGFDWEDTFNVMAVFKRPVNTMRAITAEAEAPANA